MKRKRHFSGKLHIEFPESFLKPVSMPNVIENFPLKTDVPGCGQYNSGIFNW